MAKLVCLLLFLAVLANTGFSLKCYHCNSDKQDGCLKSAGPKEQQCGKPAPGQKVVCFYKETLDANKKTASVNSSCGTIQQDQALEQLVNCEVAAPLTKKECRVCEADLCNAAPVLNTNFYVFLCLPLMYFISKLF